MDAATNPELFCNAEWSVRGDGLEHRGTGYFIPRDAVAARRGGHLWDWPLQMAEKGWCRPSAFREAFLAALDRFGVARDGELIRSFALGHGIRAAEAAPAGTFVSLGEILRPHEPAKRPPVPARAPLRALAGAGS